MNPDIETLTPPEPPTPTVQPDDPLTLLRRLLTDINADTRVVDRTKEPVRCGGITRKGQWVEPTHVVIDADGEMLGWGISEADAITDAIRREHRRTASSLTTYRETVRNYKTARDALDNL